MYELIEFKQGRPNISLSGSLENWRKRKFERRLQKLFSEEVVFNEVELKEEQKSQYRKQKSELDS
ncbi:MAG: hypothetical protein ACI85N_000820 [Gammaproteobacteria bacterium]